MPYKDPILRKKKSVERSTKWYKSNPELSHIRARDWRHRNPKYMLHAAAKRRAKASGLDFDITIDDIPDIPDLCPIALIPIFPRNDGTKGPCENSPSLDRKDTTKGYIQGNVFVISHRGNRWKSDMQRDDLLRIIQYLDS